MAFKVFAINPGSTSTKIAMFKGDKCLFSSNVSHDAKKLRQFPEISDQFAYRKQTILEEVAKAGLTLEGMDAFSGRGGGLVGLPGGVYPVNQILLHHATVGFTVKHPATLGAQLAHAFAGQYGGQAFVVNPPDVDEFADVARITGWKGVYRESRIHALNQKEIGIRYAAAHSRRYEDMDLVICHLGGGISVTAHRHGRMIDSNDIAQGDGPMAPTRGGAIPVKDVIDLCFAEGATPAAMKARMSKTGGLVDHLGTADAREVRAMIENGSDYAKLVYDAMIYQVGKYIGNMACALNGKVEAILLTGGLAHDRYLTDAVTKMVRWIAPVTVMAGEFEMEALAAGAIRALSGQEKPREYTGVPVFQGFSTEW